MQNRLVIVFGSVTTALLVVVIAMLGVVISQNAAADNRADLDRCLQSHGFSGTAPFGMDEGESSDYLEAFADALAQCR